MLLDDRGVGGRQAIELEHLNMRLKIVAAKPQVDTKLSGAALRAITPRPKSASAVRDGLAEVRETYRRVESLSATPRLRKSCGMSSTPATYGLAKTLSANRAKKKQVSDPVMLAHKLNIQNMQRRMEQQSSVTERKKNAFDATLHPSMLRRTRKSATTNALSASLTCLTAVARRKQAEEQRLRAQQKMGPRPQSARPSTAPAAASRSPVKAAAGPARKAAAALPKDMQTLAAEYRHAIMDNIIAKRIYEEGKLQALFDRMLSGVSSPEHKKVLLAVIEELKQELELA
mmetsp:Transcript_24944/g.81698  ORF Transcript_24944/g.81698 Transcript_24944/m.81698 type:complete len:287 (+) Transcript_24944:80-940(+)|eukprot:CAMPEP_0170139812 /NCGR_PEP_ID=MMETSP0033_2-20121228/5925_1 /TAXON_ID=195969 /ORGANISM="Dolichomastix tenuilepis, Strain CCMP3274" /LENGTH=286 /DNA_ID=CAMNT_0010375965 /DNA_START=78 /DNA_END=938 /DNA_ORIENTATION=-